jgi:hypothetical protein
MYIFKTILISCVASLCMLAVSFQLFRFPIKKHLGILTLFSIFAGINTYLFNYILLLNAYLPAVDLFIHAFIIHYVLKVKKRHAFFMSLISLLLYIVICGSITLVIHFLNKDELADMISGEKYDLTLRMLTELSCLVLVLVLRAYRIGFTIATIYDDTNQPRRQTGEGFGLTIFLSFMLLSTAYYLVVINISTFQWLLGAMMIAIAVLLYFLYKKEMDDR